MLYGWHRQVRGWLGGEHLRLWLCYPHRLRGKQGTPRILIVDIVTLGQLDVNDAMVHIDDHVLRIWDR
jgi:hypothetical protein